MNIWMKVQTNQSAGIPVVEVLVGLALSDDLELFQPTYVLRSYYFTFLLRRAAFPHKGVECNGNHHYHGS
jgi:hypothetical protein